MRAALSQGTSSYWGWKSLGCRFSKSLQQDCEPCGHLDVSPVRSIFCCPKPSPCGLLLILTTGKTSGLVPPFSSPPFDPFLFSSHAYELACRCAIFSLFMFASSPLKLLVPWESKASVVFWLLLLKCVFEAPNTLLMTVTIKNLTIYSTVWTWKQSTW